jgi:hypothetical protein
MFFPLFFFSCKLVSVSVCLSIPQHGHHLLT